MIPIQPPKLKMQNKYIKTKQLQNRTLQNKQK